jgi:hypothetical protein
VRALLCKIPSKTSGRRESRVGYGYFPGCVLVFCACTARLISHGNERLLFTKPAFLTERVWILDLSQSEHLSRRLPWAPRQNAFFSFSRAAPLAVCVVRGACLLAALGQCVLRHTTPMSPVYIIYSIYLARFKG